MNKINTSLLAIFLVLAFSGFSDARPERIKPGISYFSEDYSTKNNVSDISVEKNYEEVFKNYEYYEAVYDELKKVKIFRAYKRGDVILKEEYFYNSDSGLAKKEVTNDKNKVKTITFDK